MRSDAFRVMRQISTWPTRKQFISVNMWELRFRHLNYAVLPSWKTKSEVNPKHHCFRHTKILKFLRTYCLGHVVYELIKTTITDSLFCCTLLIQHAEFVRIYFKTNLFQVTFQLKIRESHVDNCVMLCKRSGQLNILIVINFYHYCINMTRKEFSIRETTSFFLL